MREPISIAERAAKQEADAQGKEWKPEPEAPASKAGKEDKAPESKAALSGEKDAPGHQSWNRRA